MASYVAGTLEFPWRTITSSTTAATIAMQDLGTAISTTGTVWQQWVNNTTSSWTITTTGDYVWDVWNQWHRPVMRTAEEEARLADLRQAQAEERSRRRLAEMQRMEGAQDRAMVLLREVVSEAEWVLKDQLIEVKGSDGHTYRIEMHRRTVHGNIVRVDEHGCVLGRACVAPRMHEGSLALPTADGWVGQYLGLKFDAQVFLSHANWSETYRGCQHPDVPILRAA